MSTDKGTRAVKDLQDWLPYAMDALGKIEADLRGATSPTVNNPEQTRFAHISGEVANAMGQLREVEKCIQTPVGKMTKGRTKKK